MCGKNLNRKIIRQNDACIPVFYHSIIQVLTFGDVHTFTTEQKKKTEPKLINLF